MLEDHCKFAKFSSSECSDWSPKVIVIQIRKIEFAKCSDQEIELTKRPHNHIIITISCRNKGFVFEFAKKECSDWSSEIVVIRIRKLGFAKCSD